MKITLVFTLLCMILQPAYGQNPTPGATKEAPPPGPLVVRQLPDFAEWVTTNTPTASPSKSGKSAGAAHTPAAVTQILVFTKTKPILRVRTLNGSTLVEDRWVMNGIQVITAPEMPFPYVLRTNGSLDQSQYEKSDFPELDWISEAKFQGTIQDPTSNRKVLLFKDLLKKTAGVDHVVETKGVVAEVDFETRLPVYLRDLSSIRTYEIKNPPSAAQTVPEAVLQTIAQEARNTAVLNRSAGKP